jgi:lipid II:glycine glycyltransferase (peptidoglycan interpeptide bridge formation enzyme)
MTTREETYPDMETFREDLFLEHVAAHTSGSTVCTLSVQGSSLHYMMQKKGTFSYCWNFPHGLYLPGLEKEELESMLAAMSGIRSSQTVINAGPVEGMNKSVAVELAKKYGFEIQVGKCHVVDTRPNAEEIFGQFNSTRKKHIKRYQKAGVVNVFRTKEARYFREYFALYEDSAKRWGSSTAYGKEFLEGLYVVPGIYMWVAEKEGVMISAMICIYRGRKVFDWLAASIINDDIKKLYAAGAVQYEVIRDAVERGLEHVNMGASKDLEGVSDFKDSWGAEERETYTFIKKSGIFAVLKKIRGLIRK